MNSVCVGHLIRNTLESSLFDALCLCLGLGTLYAEFLRPRHHARLSPSGPP